MKFGKIPVDTAEGALLAHSIKLSGGVFKKGRLLSAEDLRKLREAGIETVAAARLEPDDVGEDEAATIVAEAIGGENVSAGASFTGRANLVAETAGVVIIDTDRLDRLNLVDEAVTVGTVPPFSVVAPKQMAATIKIIPFAAPRRVVEECAAIGRESGPLLRVAAFRPKTAALIQTRLPGLKETVLDKTVEITRKRLASIGAELVQESRCAHDEAEVARAVGAAKVAGADIVLVAGASAIVDRRDVLPSGIERAGGRIVHFGMPVDPGNLILMAELDGAPVVGLPGCARSPKLNGIDWVLQRLAADLPVGGREIMLMGAGGLLTEIPARPLPRAEATRSRAETAPREPRVAAVVLAAGQSRRMGANKMLSEIAGLPMLRTVVDHVLRSKAQPIVVVAGHEAERVRALLEKRPVRVVENPHYAEGLSTSLKAGLAAVPEEADGAVVCLGDMPRVSATHINRLIAAFNPEEGRAICVPTYKGKQGNPVLWDRRFFDDIRRLSGDVGAKHLIGENGDQVAEVAMDDAGVLLDIDTPAALAEINSGSSSGA